MRMKQKPWIPFELVHGAKSSLSQPLAGANTVLSCEAINQVKPNSAARNPPGRDSAALASKG